MLEIVWYGCDICHRWWHRHCLSSELQTIADLSCFDNDTVFRCPACPPLTLCAVCFIEGTDTKQFAQCQNCFTNYHTDCLPQEHYTEYALFQNLGKDWFCSRCEVEK